MKAWNKEMKTMIQSDNLNWRLLPRKVVKIKDYIEYDTKQH